MGFAARPVFELNPWLDVARAGVAVAMPALVKAGIEYKLMHIYVVNCPGNCFYIVSISKIVHDKA
jgi:hypothetical protein